MQLNLENLIEAGVHFGHRASRWHPKMAPFIFGKRNLIHIIDIRQTVRGLVRSSNFLSNLVASGKEVIFVGTKRQAKSVIQKEAQRCGMHWISERWLGGTLTNYHTIRARLKRLEELEELERSGEIELYSKKRISSLRRERKKIHRNLEGIRNMKQLPGCLVVVDIRREYIAVREARKIGIPVVAIVDTDCDPTQVDIPIPGNDDAYRSVQQILQVLVDSIIAGRDKYVQAQAAAEKARLEEEARVAAEAKQKAAAAAKEAAEKKAVEAKIAAARAAEAKAAEAKKAPDAKTPEAKAREAAAATAGEAKPETVAGGGESTAPSTPAGS